MAKNNSKEHLKYLLKKEREVRAKEHEFIDELLKDKRMLEREVRELKRMKRYPKRKKELVIAAEMIHQLKEAGFSFDEMISVFQLARKRFEEMKGKSRNAEESFI